MDLYEASRMLQEVQEKYLRWREARRELLEWPADEPVTGWLADECRVFDSAAPLESGTATAMRLAAMEPALKERLTGARRDAWYEQGKTLRFALVLLENRLCSVREELEGLAEADIPLTQRPMQLLETQMDSLRANLAEWESRRRRSTATCSLAELERMIADPYHAADKEHLERVAARAREADLPQAGISIRLEWESVSGEVLSAEIVAEDAARRAA